MSYRHLFGPVPSRRLGVSLGIDIVPYKYCSMNCIYCEIGKTTNLTLARKEYVPYDEIVSELADYLSTEPVLDFLTFSGAGEPTLNNRIGDIISFLKKGFSKYKIALITNSTLLPDEYLRKDIRDIDLILPSLDAVSQEVFEKINRPTSGLSTKAVIEGLISYRRESRAEMWLEIFFLPGINDSDHELSLFKEVLGKIDPHRIQLNSLDRPGTERWLIKESDEKLREMAAYLEPLPVEIISRKSTDVKFPEINQEMQDKLTATLRRRPCTVEDISKILNLHIDEVAKYLDYLKKIGLLRAEEQDAGVFYRLNINSQ